jgi:UDP-N-acetylbacillosamine N-acetyltransferase
MVNFHSQQRFRSPYKIRKQIQNIMARKQKTTPLPLLIWGASGHARVVADIIRLTGKFEITGFIDNIDPSRHGSEFCGAEVLGGQEKLGQFHNMGNRHIILGFGNCEARLTLSIVVQELGFELANAIHPKAILAQDIAIGGGSVIMAGAVINPGTIVGENVIINTSSSVDHDCHIENGAHIGPGAHLGGGVTIGQASWIGIGAVIKDKIKIGKGAIIGAGAVVLTDIPDGVVAFGVPAKVKRDVKA